MLSMYIKVALRHSVKDVVDILNHLLHTVRHHSHGIRQRTDLILGFVCDAHIKITFSHLNCCLLHFLDTLEDHACDDGGKDSAEYNCKRTDANDDQTCKCGPCIHIILCDLRIRLLISLDVIDRSADRSKLRLKLVLVDLEGACCIMCDSSCLEMIKRSVHLSEIGFDGRNISHVTGIMLLQRCYKRFHFGKSLVSQLQTLVGFRRISGRRCVQHILRDLIQRYLKLIGCLNISKGFCIEIIYNALNGHKCRGCKRNHNDKQYDDAAKC